MKFIKKVKKWGVHNYWNLDPFGSGKRFDVHEFIRLAEDGQYDGYCGFDRSDSWYQGLKQVVTEGGYEKTLFNRLRYFFARLRNVAAAFYWYGLPDGDVYSDPWIAAAVYISKSDCVSSIDDLAAGRMILGSLHSRGSRVWR